MDTPIATRLFRPGEAANTLHAIASASRARAGGAGARTGSTWKNCLILGSNSALSAAIDLSSEPTLATLVT